MKKVTKRFIRGMNVALSAILIALLGLGGLMVSPTPAAAQGVVVSVTKVAVAGGGAGTAYVSVSNIPAPGLGAYDIWVNFDNTRITITGINAVSFDPFTLTFASNTPAQANTAGRVMISGFQAAPPGPTGTIALAAISLTINQAGTFALTPLVNMLTAADPGLTAIPNTISAGQAIRTPGPTVSISHATLQVGPANSANLNVMVDNFTDPQGLGAYELRMNFDRTRVKVNSVMGGAAPFNAQPVNNRLTDGHPQDANTVGFLRLTVIPTWAQGPIGNGILIAVINVSLLAGTPVPGFENLPLTIDVLSDIVGDEYASGAANPGGLHSSATAIPTVTVGSRTIDVGLASSGNITVIATNVPAVGLAAWEFQLTFDPTKVKINGVTGVAPFDANLSTSSLATANTTGSLTVTAFQNSGVPTGTVPLANISVSALVAGTSSLIIGINTFTAADGPGTPVTTNVVHGSVTGGTLPPTAGFTIALNPVSGIAPVTVTFTNTSTGATSYSWDFGDTGAGSTSNAATPPNKVYSNPGTFTITLTATNTAGSNIFTQQVTILAIPVSSFTMTKAPLSGVAPVLVTFTDNSTGGPTSWSWDFGDGTGSSTQNVTKTYSTPGNYTVTLRVSNVAAPGGVASSQALAVYGNPAAGFTKTLNPANGVRPVTVNTTATSTGNIVTHTWNWGDGSPTQTGNTASHIYSDPGNFTISLTATNPAGSNTTTQVVSVYRAPNANFNAVGVINTLTVNFTDTSDGNIVSWLWNFGDGTTSSTQNPSHTYSSAQRVDVSLTVTNPAGGATRTRTVDVSLLGTFDPPAATFTRTLNPANGKVPVVVNFNDTSSGPALTWDWNFGDGTAHSNTKNPSHTYSTPGNYTVALAVTNPVSSSNTSQAISVYDTPVPGFNAARIPRGFTFTDLSTGNIVSWFWQFPDGSTSTLQTPGNKTFTTLGVAQPVTLAVNNPLVVGPNPTLTQNVTAYDTPAANFAFAIAPATGVPATVTFTDTSTGPGVSWLWNFGDGTGSSSQNPQHVYNAVGAYTVGLTINNPLGPANTRTQTVNIQAGGAAIIVGGGGAPVAPPAPPPPPPAPAPVVVTIPGGNITINPGSVARDAQGNPAPPTPGQNISVTIAPDGTTTLTIPASTGRDTTLASFTDPVSGVKFENNTLTVPVVQQGVVLGNIIVTTGPAQGQGATAQAAVTSIKYAASPVAHTALMVGSSKPGAAPGQAQLTLQLKSLPTGAAISTVLLSGADAVAKIKAVLAKFNIKDTALGLDVSATNVDITGATIEFVAPKTWVDGAGGVASLGIARESATVAEVVKPKSATVVGDTVKVVAETAGASVFALVALQVVPTPTPPPPPTVAPTTPAPTPAPTTPAVKPTAKPPTPAPKPTTPAPTTPAVKPTAKPTTPPPVVVVTPPPPAPKPPAPTPTVAPPAPPAPPGPNLTLIISIIVALLIALFIVWFFFFRRRKAEED
ncbi:MAG: PKD domain-containing protein [Chloroflexi bacterium]|nr:PKD domain-containing protein [Chloroflexota bacterium]